MSSVSFKQAICNAIEAEKEAAKLYLELSEKAEDPNAIAFLKDLAKTETGHMQELEKIRGNFADDDLCGSFSHMPNVEAPLGWENAENINFVDAINLAIQGENNASMIYDAMADSTEGDLSEFFRSLSRTENLHAEKLDKVKKRSLKHDLP